MTLNHNESKQLCSTHKCNYWPCSNHKIIDFHCHANTTLVSHFIATVDLKLLFKHTCYGLCSAYNINREYIYIYIHIFVLIYIRDLALNTFCIKEEETHFILTYKTCLLKNITDTCYI
jgi:hypothetical protein